MYIPTRRPSDLPQSGTATGLYGSSLDSNFTESSPNPYSYYTLFKVATIVLLSIISVIFIGFILTILFHTYRIAVGKPGLFRKHRSGLAREFKRPNTPVERQSFNPVVRRPLPQPPVQNGTTRDLLHPMNRRSGESEVSGEIAMAQRVSVAYATPTISQRGTPSPSRFQLMTSLPVASDLLNGSDASMERSRYREARRRSMKGKAYQSVREDNVDVKPPIHASFGSPGVLVLPPTPSVPDAPQFDHQPIPESSKYLRPFYSDDHISKSDLLEVPLGGLEQEPGLYQSDVNGHQPLRNSDREVGRNAQINREDSLGIHQEFLTRATSAFSDATEIEVARRGIAAWTGITLSPSLASSLNQFTSYFSLPRLRKNEDTTALPHSRSGSKPSLVESANTPSSTQRIRGTFGRTESRKLPISPRGYHDVLAEMETLEKPSLTLKESPQYALDDDPFRRPSPLPGIPQKWMRDPLPETPQSDNISMRMLVRSMMSTPSPKHLAEPPNQSFASLPETPSRTQLETGDRAKRSLLVENSSANVPRQAKARVSDKSLPGLPHITFNRSPQPRPMNPTPSKGARSPDKSVVSDAGMITQGASSAWSVGNISGESEMRRRQDPDGNSKRNALYDSPILFGSVVGSSTPKALTSRHPASISDSNSAHSQTDRRSRSLNLSEFPSPPQVVFGHHSIRRSPQHAPTSDVQSSYLATLPRDVLEDEDEYGDEVIVDASADGDSSYLIKPNETSFTIEDYFEQDSELGTLYNYEDPDRYPQRTLTPPTRRPFPANMLPNPRTVISSKNVKSPSRSPRKFHR